MEYVKFVRGGARSAINIFIVHLDVRQPHDRLGPLSTVAVVLLDGIPTPSSSILYGFLPSLSSSPPSICLILMTECYKKGGNHPLDEKKIKQKSFASLRPD